MPTGYTAAIAEGISFEKFAMNCARAFGICISMRDEPMGVQIPESFEPDSYHCDEVERLKLERERIMLLSETECADETKKEYDEEHKRCTEHIKANQDLRAKYQEMLEQVRAWRHPTPDHQSLKLFMIEQISSSMEFDCIDTYYIESLDKLVMKEGKQWQEEQIAELDEQIAYHAEKYAAEKKRTEFSNNYIKALRDSLKTGETNVHEA